MNAQHATVVGVFEDRQQADRAVDALHRAGFREEQIGVALRHDQGEFDEDALSDAGDESRAGTGAMTGALAGLGFGALAGLGVLSGVIPVIGPAIAGGTLGVILTNAAAGAGLGGLAGALAGAGVPEDEAHYYQGEFEAGRVIVTVHAENRPSEALAIMNQYDAYDMTSRSDATGGHSPTSTTMPRDVPVRREDVMGGAADEGVDILDRGPGPRLL